MAKAGIGGEIIGHEFPRSTNIRSSAQRAMRRQLSSPTIAGAIPRFSRSRDSLGSMFDNRICLQQGRASSVCARRMTFVGDLHIMITLFVAGRRLTCELRQRSFIANAIFRQFELS
jgi:hypothetical protein